MRVFLWNVDFERLARNFTAWYKSTREALRNGEMWRTLKVWVRANGLFALASLAIATVIYLLVRDTLNISQKTTLKVDVLILDGEKRISGVAEPSEITVDVWGKEADVNNFVREAKTVQLRIPRAKIAGEGGSVKIKSQRDIPSARKFGVLASPVGRGRVKVTFDEPGEVEFRIAEPVVVGTPHHRTIKSTDYNPKVAKVRGGKSRLLNLSELYKLELDQIDVQNRADDYIGVARIRIPTELRESGDVKLVDVTEVEVRVTFEKREKTKTFTKLPVRLSIAPGTVIPEKSVLEPVFVSAKVTGYDESVDALSNNMVTAFAVIPSASTLNHDPGATNTLPVELVVPHNSEIWKTECSPPAVKLVMPLPAPAPVTEDEPPQADAAKPEEGLGQGGAAAASGEVAGLPGESEKPNVSEMKVVEETKMSDEKKAEASPEAATEKPAANGGPALQLDNAKEEKDE